MALTAALIGSVVGNKLINLVCFLSTPLFLHLAVAPSLAHPERHLLIPLTADALISSR